MSRQKSRRVLVGVTGGIAAYKSPELVRRLRQRGCDVRVILTDGGSAFITPLSLQAVSGHPVHRRLLDAEAESTMPHIELARWAEHIVVAPASAHCIARLATGQADDLLSTVLLATTARVSLAPAMNRQMWQHPATQENLKTVQARGVSIIGPGQGSQACGETGPGRMSEPDDIAALIAGPAPVLSGKRLLITAGPTFEAIDPVRGITNHSSGKMGYAVAQAGVDCGAEVCLISGPVSLTAADGVERIDVQSAQQMRDAVMARVAVADVFIGVAAVADYRPVTVAGQKLKKQADSMVIKLTKTPDILAAVAALEAPPFTVGFAAETENVLPNARKKRDAKRVDLMVANDVSPSSGTFAGDSNCITLITQQEQVALERGDKYSLALQLLQYVAGRL